MITEIELYNWKTHQHTKLNFQKGVNVLIGVMGAGKSSVIDGISFALFGTFPALTHKRVKLENLIKSRPNKQSEAEVKLSFEIGKDTYMVSRKFTTSGGTMARLEKNGSHLQTQTVRVNEEIESLLKINYDTFSRAVYSEQNRLDYFLTVAKSDRKKQIDNMLGLDQFATAEENCTSLINNLKAMISDEESMLGQIDVASLKKQLEKISVERKGITDEQHELEAKATAEEKLLTDIKSQLEKQKTLYNKKEALSKELIDIKSRIKTIQEEVKKIESQGIEEGTLTTYFNEKNSKEKEMLQEIEELKKKEKSAGKQLAELQASIDQNQKMVKERDKILSSIKNKDEKALVKKIDDETSALNELKGSEVSAKARKKENEEWVKELSKHLSRCPICERELDEALRKRLFEGKNELTKKIEEEIQKIQTSIDSKNEIVKELTKEYNSVLLANSKLKDYTDIDEKIKEHTQKLGLIKKEHEISVNSIDKSTEQLDLLKEELQKIKLSMETLKRKKGYESDIKKCFELEAQKAKEFEGIEVDQEKLDALQGSFTKKSALISEISTKIASNKKYVIGIDSQITDLVKRIDSIMSIEQRVTTRRTQLQTLNKFKIALVETETLLRNKLVESINYLMRDVWPELYPYGDYTTLRLSAKPDDYILEADLGIDGKEDWVSIESVASGGERNIACLAMRIALAMVIVPNLKWLILDEPTHNVDVNGIAKLINVLSDSLPKVVDQIFIITHDDNLKQIAAAKVYELERDKGTYGPTKINEL